MGEAVHLRHRNIDVVAEDKRHVLHINVEDGKTGKRIVKTLPTAVRYYQAICDLTNHTDADDWLFANADGTQYASYEHAISSQSPHSPSLRFHHIQHFAEVLIIDAEM